ncbi:MAG: HAD family phosphatase [Dehalococcoidales bacterium]|nr:HAD family phosphatase [Dehalococcoidales bacterium]
MTKGKLRAAIWDMDGVIADTAQYHFASWQNVFHRRGAFFTAEDFKHHFGQRNDTIIRDTIPKVTPEDLETIIREKEEYFRSHVAGNVRPLPGAIEMMHALREHGVTMAIASSSPPENIRLILESLGIYDLFHAIVFGREVKEGKPSPQCYLLAAEKLGVKPENCVVFEDAVAGVKGARRGGMKCVALTTTHPRESLQEADLVVGTLAEATVQDLEKLFNKNRSIK